MAWGRLDDQANGNPKLLALSDPAWRMWGCALIYCQAQLTDGFVPSVAIHTFGVQARDKDKVAEELCAVQVRGRAPLWAKVDGGYAIHDYLEWNDSREVVLAKRSKDRKRKGFHGDSTRNPNGTDTESARTWHGSARDSDRPTSTPDPQERTSTAAPRRSPPKPVDIAHPSSHATPGTFGLYCTIAREARQQSNDVDRSDSIANIAEWFKSFCAQRSIAYDGEVVSKAIEAVMKADARETVGLVRRHG